METRSEDRCFLQPFPPSGCQASVSACLCSSVPLPRTFLLFAFLCSDQAQPPLPPPPTITVVCCVLVSGLVGFCLVPLFSSGSEKHQAFHPGPGAFQPKPMQSWRSGGLHTQWQAHNSIRSQVLMGRTCLHRQALTGPNAPVGKCLWKALSRDRGRGLPPLWSPHHPAQACKSAGSALLLRMGRSPFNKLSSEDSILSSQVRGCSRSQALVLCRAVEPIGSRSSDETDRDTCVCLSGRSEVATRTEASKHGYDLHQVLPCRPWGRCKAARCADALETVCRPPPLCPARVHSIQSPQNRAAGLSACLGLLSLLPFSLPRKILAHLCQTLHCFEHPGSRTELGTSPTCPWALPGRHSDLRWKP